MTGRLPVHSRSNIFAVSWSIACYWFVVLLSLEVLEIFGRTFDDALVSRVNSDIYFWAVKYV